MAKEAAAANADKMGSMPIPKLLFSMAVPMMLSMMMNALYNVVDSVFVARLSEDALTAVSLAFPLQNIMISVGVGWKTRRWWLMAAFPICASAACCPLACC